jgi:TolA-binding protein
VAAAVAACEGAPEPRRWGGALPAALLLALAGSRLLASSPSPEGDPRALYERASRAYAEDRFADAAEYARHAATLAGATPQRAELLCLRGESLLRAGEPRLAAEAFDAVLRESDDGPYVPQALFGSAAAHEAVGGTEHAADARARLQLRFPDNPWTRRALEGR